MKNSHIISLATICLSSILLLAFTVNDSVAYDTYDGCSASSCHGDFRGSTSPKGTVFPGGKNHDMHRGGGNMATACDVCHTDPDRTPVYIGKSEGTANNLGLGCTGCHEAEGLRAHHVNNGVSCGGCHTSPTPPPEGTIPTYYGTADTKVENPCNSALVSNTNENWSVGDFLGIDNDGDNLYDLADFDCGPPYRMISAVPEGDNVRVTWETVGGRTDAVQASGDVGGSYGDVSSSIVIPGVGLVTTNFVEIGEAANASRFYRVRYAP